MFDNISKKIKGLSKALYVLEAIAAFITGITLIAIGKGFILIGLLIMVIGPIIALIPSWLLYGFAEIIDKLYDIERSTINGERKSELQTNFNSERIRNIERLRSKGLITEDEYQKSISK